MNKSESTSARWARVIEEQRASGLSIAEFCRRRSVSPPSFFDWRRRLSASEPTRATPAFVEVKVGPGEALGSQTVGARGDAALELVLRSGLRVRVRRGFDRALLRELLAALEPPEPPEATP
ncbi:MAG: transposase [Planctomycetota bacterium]|nr:transposase [Planctomycetota bacterium]